MSEAASVPSANPEREFRAVVPTKVLLKATKGLKGLIGEMEARFDPHGEAFLRLLAPNAAHHVFANIDFKTGTVSGPALRVLVDVDDLHARLKAFDSKADVELLASKVRLKFVQEGFSRVVPLPETAPPSYPTPDLEPTAAVRVDLKAFLQFLRMAEETSDHIILEAKGDSFSARASSKDGTNDVWSSNGPVTGDGRSTYDLDYLKRIVSAAKELDKEALLQFGTDTPLIVSVTTDDVDATYILAERKDL